MKPILRTFRNDKSFGADYTAVRNFLMEQDNHNYLFGRWDWMVTHGYLDKTGLEKIGLWEENGRLVALAIYDGELGGGYLVGGTGDAGLRREMLEYAQTALAKDGKFRVVILDGDMLSQQVAVDLGYRPTQDKECDAVLPLDADLSYQLPEGFKIVSMKDDLNYYQYGRVLWKGFNHEADGEGPFRYRGDSAYDPEFLRPNLNLDLKIAVAAPDGNFVSYCGMWQDPATGSALVEPVATDPDFRRMGMGKAAVLEACRRCKELGAKRAFVGSSQQFYYSIGFRPYATSTWWERP